MGRRLHVLIPKGLDERVSRAAQRVGVSKSKWVRRAILDALGRTEQARRPSADPLARMASLGAPTADVERMIAEIGAGRI